MIYSNKAQTNNMYTTEFAQYTIKEYAFTKNSQLIKQFE